MSNTCTDESVALELFHANTRLAYKIACHYKNRNARIEIDDMTQVALMGLWEAALLYDPSTGNKFSTIATHYCNGRCLTYIQGKGDLVRKTSQFFWNLPSQKRVVAKPNDEGDCPTDVMLDKLTKHETSTPLDFLLEAEEHAEDLKLLHSSLDSLPWEQAYILERRYRDEMRVEDVAAEIGVSKSHIIYWTTKAIVQLTGKASERLNRAQKSAERMQKRKVERQKMEKEEWERLKAFARPKKAKVKGRSRTYASLARTKPMPSPKPKVEKLKRVPKPKVEKLKKVTVKEKALIKKSDREEKNRIKMEAAEEAKRLKAEAKASKAALKEKLRAEKRARKWALRATKRVITKAKAAAIRAEKARAKVSEGTKKRMKLSDQQVLEIVALKGVETAMVLASRYGVSTVTIARIWNGRQRTTVTGNKVKPPRERLTLEDVAEIRASKGLVPAKVLATRYGVYWTTIHKIWRGVLYSSKKRSKILVKT